MGYNGTASCKINNTDSSSDGTLAVSYKGKSISMNLKFVEITAVEEDTNQKYGFDDYSVTVYNSSKAEYIENNIWKSIAKNDSDSFYITLSHADTWQEIQTHKDKFITIADQTKITSVDVATGNAKSKITANSGVKGESSFKINLAGGELEYEIKNQKHVIIGTNENLGIPEFRIDHIGTRKNSSIGVVVYEKKNNTVAIREVNDSKNNLIVPNSHQFKGITSDDLNQYYKQAVVSWDIYYNINSIDIEYDKDGMLNHFQEADYIIPLAKDDSKNYNLFIVKKLLGNSRGFVRSIGSKYSFVSIDDGDMKTIAHELGHSQNLRHLNIDEENLFSFLFYEGYNLMFSHRITIIETGESVNQNRLLKKQWDELQK